MGWRVKFRRGSVVVPDGRVVLFGRIYASRRRVFDVIRLSRFLTEVERFLEIIFHSHDQVRGNIANERSNCTTGPERRQAGRVWSVSHGGDPFGHSRDKEIARAAALRRARELLDKGHACEVRVFGETANWRG